MQITISDTPWQKSLLGMSKQHDPALAYGDEMRQMLAPVWEAVRGGQIAVTGINHVVYGAQDEIFCGLECGGEVMPVPGLELRRFELAAYAYYRHIGPYAQIPDACRAMQAELTRLGRRAVIPTVECYGHWHDDPQQLVTEILMRISPMITIPDDKN